ncbi:death related ICE-like caspase [Arctopsyche grandis]|uniref:death related ICE-like caspase n=1 Tax=Arctopsyche grandis TaxID=121162 RepID=UPI00406D90C5
MGRGGGGGVGLSPAMRCAMHYNMRHPKRGMALIFNHETFASPALKQRLGTNVDCDALDKTLRSLGFAVTVKRDLPFSGVRDYIAMMAAADHSAFDCMIVVVLSHGELGRLHAYDTHYKPDQLWHSFTADRCPTLAGKPKLFFIQACQGEELDPGVKLRDRTETDGQHSADYKIPVHADFLIAYSTVPGYFSWRNTTRGSWFIQALVEELKAHGTTRDILTLLTFVNQKVALNYESNTPDCPVMHQQKQISCFSSMLTRMLIFGHKT